MNNKEAMSGETQKSRNYFSDHAIRTDGVVKMLKKRVLFRNEILKALFLVFGTAQK